MTRRVLILGAGGHGQMVADALLAANRAGASDVPIGFADDDERLHGSSVLGLPVLASVAQLHAARFDTIVVAVGSNKDRMGILVALRAAGAQLANAIHPTAIISPDVRLGLGIFAAAGVIVNTGSLVADGVILSTGCTIGHHSRIADYAHVGPGVHLGGHVTIGEGAMVGVGAAVIPGKTIGDWAVVGAGAAVIENIPPRCVAVGVPARVIKSTRAEVEDYHPLSPQATPIRASVAPCAPVPNAAPE